MAMTSWEVTLVSAAKAGDSMAFEELYEGFVYVKRNGKYGFMDTSGRVVVPIEYDWVTSFNEGHALAGKDDKVYILRIEDWVS